MPIYYVGKERESLTSTGEYYKRAVRTYLESLGYSQTTDSFHEGHFPDMIFVNSSIDPGRPFWIETKNTKVSLSQKKFCKELLNYLYEWVERPPKKRFKLMIFVQEIIKKSSWDSLFRNPIDEEFLFNWLEKNKSLISKNKSEIIEKKSKDEIIDFFKETEVFV